MWHSVGAEMGDGGDGAGKTVRGLTLQGLEGCVENFGLHPKKNWKTLDVLCREVPSSKVMLLCHGENSTWMGIYVVDNVGAVAVAARVRDDGGLSRATL